MTAAWETLSFGVGGRRIKLEARFAGSDLIVFISNENAHVGAVSLAEYDERTERVSTSVLTRIAHKDDAVATTAAYRIAKAAKRAVCAVAGIHLDAATAEEIAEMQHNAAGAVDVLLESGFCEVNREVAAPPGCCAHLPPELSPSQLAVYVAARPWLQIRNNDLHARISCRFAMEILKREGGNPDVVLPGVLLHDVGWHAVGEDRLQGAYGPHATDAALVRFHEMEGAIIAGRVLLSCAWSPALTEEICRIISRHDTGVTCGTLEEAIVRDADKCYRATRVAFLYFPEQVGMSQQGWYDWLTDGFCHWMFTAGGRELAEECLEATRHDLGLLAHGRTAPADGLSGPPEIG